MSFFDDSHVTDVGLQGSLGPSVSFTEMVAQGFRQQFRVDSARALDEELRNRWLESLRMAQITDQVAVAPDPLGRNPTVDPDDPWAYRAFAQHVSGQPVDTFDPNKPLFGYDPTARLKGMIDANEKIKALNNPNIKTFEQILEEVSQMQREVEGETASMSERGGGWFPSLLGAMAGSLTTRDPLNIVTAPIGAGRTVAMRIATDMGLAAAVTGYTELAEVAPARQIAGLPERNPLYNIVAATAGAGVIRGALIEPISAGIKRFKAGTEIVDFDLRDSQLAQMFEANIDKPSARAGLAILDDATFIERNNPYGPGHQANTRFLAELQSVQRAMNGEPMTAVARVLPMMPYDYIKKAADFEIVREQAPQVYAKMEAAQAKLARQSEPEIIDASTLGLRHTDTEGALDIEAAGVELRQQVSEAIKQGAEVSLIVEGKSRRITGARKLGIVDEQNQPWGAAAILMAKPGDNARVEIKQRAGVTSRRAANAEYQAAYRAVEAEAAAINTRQRAAEAAQQRESVGILASEGLPFTGPLLRYDNVETLVERINKFNDTLDERTAARFVRETVGEGENKVEVEVWEKDGGIDIGLKDPVDPNFRFVTDEGEMTVAQAMRDLQDDADLVEAIKGCAI